MTVSTGKYLKNFFDVSNAMGAKAISSDFAFEIEGFEQMYLLCKQAPWPELTPGGEIEVPTPLGTKMWQPQQVNTAQQGPISLMETVAGSIDNMMLGLLARGGTFNAMIYEGTPQNFIRAKRLQSCFIQLDSPDRDWENRSQILLFSGTLFFHYFGEVISGNSKDYR